MDGYELIRSRRRTAALEVTRDGRVLVRAPLRMPRQAIDAFVAKKLAGKSLDRKELQKVSAALARRGYSWSDINDALRRCGAETGEDY